MKIIVIRIICTLAAGLMIFRFALPGMLRGGAAGVEVGLVTPYLDSEYRFLSALALGIGGVFIYLLVTIRQNPKLLFILAGAIFVGGLMRLVSMGSFGAPTMAELIPTVVELALPATAGLLTLLVVREGRTAGG